MAVKLAQEAAEPKLESIANVNEAPLQPQAGKMNEALRLYRRALDLDEGASDNAVATVDWFV